MTLLYSSDNISLISPYVYDRDGLTDGATRYVSFTNRFAFTGDGGREDATDGGGGPPVVAKFTVLQGGRKLQRVYHHRKRHLSRSSSGVDHPPGNALINELGNPDNMFVTENGTVVTSQIGGTAILPCATAKLGMATVSKTQKKKKIVIRTRKDCDQLYVNAMINRLVQENENLYCILLDYEHSEKCNSFTIKCIYIYIIYTYAYHFLGKIF